MVQGLGKLVGLPEVGELRPVRERSETEIDGGIGGGDRKALSRSLHKARFNTDIGVLEQQTVLPKKFLLPPEKEESCAKKIPKDKKSSDSPSHFPPRALFQSCSSKLSRPKALKSIFPANHRV